MTDISDKLQSPKTVFRATVIASSLAAAGVIGYWYYIASRIISTDNAYVESEIDSVNSRLMGYVREVMVQENQQVKKGELLLKLDDSDVKIELLYKEAKNKKAQADLKRARAIWKKHGISDADKEMAEAAATGQLADLEGSKLKWSFTEITAPIDGVIAKRAAQPGQFVQPGQALFVIVPNHDLWVRANYKENQIRKLRKGQRVDLEIDAFPGRRWKGKIDSIYPSTVASLSLLTPSNTTGNFTKVVQRFSVKIRFDEGSDLEGLRTGMSAVPKAIVD